MGEVLEQDVDGVGNAIRALELLSRQDGPAGFDERVERVPDHDTQVLQAHLVDALVDGRNQLDQLDGLAVDDLERLGGNCAFRYGIASSRVGEGKSETRGSGGVNACGFDSRHSSSRV